MKRVVGVVLVLAAVGGGAWWLATRGADSGQARGRAPLERGRGGAADASARGARTPGAPTRGAVDPQALTRKELRIDPARAVIRREELVRQIRQVGASGEKPAAPRKQAITAAIKAVKPRMVDCYRKRLAERQGLQGTSVVTFTIVARDGRGRLEQGEIVSSTLDDPRLSSCMLRALTRTSFPVPGGDGRVPVRYPFTFKP